MPQLFTPSAMDEALGFSGEESDADLMGAAYGTEDNAPEPAVPQTPAPDPIDPAPAPVDPAPAPAVQAQPPPATDPQQPTLAEILARMEAQAQRQTQILERAVPQPPQTPQAPAVRPLPVIPEQYRGAIDEDTLRGAQVVMDILGITPKLERLEKFEQAQTERETGNAAGQFITSQVPEMKDPVFQQEVVAEVERQFDLAGVPKEARAQFLNPFLFVQAGNAVKSRRSQSAAPSAPSTPAINQALASRAGGETHSEPVAASVSDTSQQPVDWMDMSEEDFAKRQAAILRKQNGSW
jgi:hypothetical protein